MRKLLVILFALLSINTVAQNPHLDSVKQVLANAKEDTTKALLLSSISNEMCVIDAKEALKYAEQGIKLSTKLRFNKGLTMCNKNVGLCYYFLSNYPKALEYMFLALKYAEKGSKAEGLAYSNIAMVYSALSKKQEALDYYFRALETHKKLGLKVPLAYHMANIGMMYNDLGNDSLAEVYTREALKLFEGPNAGVAGCLTTLGRLAVKKGNYGEALSLELQAMKINEDAGDNVGICVVANNLAEAYQAIIKDSTGTAKSDSIIPTKKVALQKMYSYLQRAIALATELGELNQLQAAYETLTDYYKLMGNSAMALKSFEKYSELRDSVFSQENELKVESLANQHELDMKKKEIELREKEVELQRLLVRKKRNESYFLMGGVGLMLVVVFFTIKERKKSDRLLLNILPRKIAQRLKNKEHPIADHFSNATIVFIDMVEFTRFAEMNPPKETVQVLDGVFTMFDAIAEKYGLEKIKTIGDCYMAVSGLPEPRPDHAIAAAKMVLDIKQAMQGFTTPDGTKIMFRMGLDCGAVVAGVIGKKKFIYDLWGDPVNTASRMESTGVAGEIQCTDNFKQQAESHFRFVSRGEIVIKNKGTMHTWFLEGEK
jgi:adenylate cyclase